MELYAGIDVFVNAVNLPLFIKAFLKEDQGNYYIYVNCNITLEEQKRALRHEYLHLVCKDIEDDDPTEEIERRNR